MESDTTDDEENYLKNPIGPTKPAPSALSVIETNIPSPIAQVRIIVKTGPFFTSAKYPFILSSISVPRNPSPVKTDQIHPTVDISAREFDKIMIYGLDPIITLAKNCLNIDRADHEYFSGTGKSFVIMFRSCRFCSYVTYIS